MTNIMTLKAISSVIEESNNDDIAKTMAKTTANQPESVSIICQTP